ncbi:hypothetical protein HIM_07045 [Hirsutella minnesotensis 3608]|uniref:Nudix hydrolase domain-containing protein n=1 Tax=Hirsutella minnesotensis 3608 TaxID=1043627 RepID=A0A0F8A4F5_9HYPO|nr:hypothetical protein HIM_07045 [Hirsutella minnesotensis 3608]
MSPIALAAHDLPRSMVGYGAATAGFRSWKLGRMVPKRRHARPSFYEVIRQCNKFDRDIGSLWEFCLLDNTRPVGYMLPEFVKNMAWDGTGFRVDKSKRRVHLAVTIGHDDDIVDVCREEFVALCEKNAAVVGGLRKWLGKKSDFHPIRGLDSHLAGLEMPSPLRGVFGIVTSGVHMNVFTMRKVKGRPKMHIWVSKRSENVTYAGKLDQIVAGAMDPVDGLDPLRTLRREALEEARLSIDPTSRKVAANGAPVGTVEPGRRISFYDRKDPAAGAEQGQLEPGVRFTFDLEVDASFTPQPGEPEAVANFILKTVDEVKRDLVRAEWKPNCGLVMLDFLLRKGHIRPEDDELYGLLRQGLHRELPFANI